MRWFNIFLVMFLLILQYRLWAGEGSIGQIFVLKEKLVKQQLLNEKLIQRNNRLAAEVIGLHEGHASIEEYARSELGLIKPNETFFLVVDHSN